MNIKRILANAVARRVAYVLVAAALVWLGLGDAKAQYNYHANQGAAYEACEVAIAQTIAQQAGGPTPRSRNADTCKHYANGSSPFFRGHFTQTTTSTGQTQQGTVGDFYYRLADTCSTQPAKTSGLFSSSSTTFCSGGCSYASAASKPAITIGGRTYYSGVGATPTGATCAHGSGDGPGVVSNDDCQQIGGLTQCVKSDGRHCAVSSSGKQHCWTPTEAGTKASGNEGATKSPANTNVNVPPKSPTNGGDWEQTAQGTSSTTVGGSTTNYNITNWSSTYGPEGSGGTGSGDGEGEGEGDGHGTIGGDGECGGSFTCTGGDPVLCAIAKQQYLARCEGKSRFDGDAAPFPGNGDGGAGEDPDPAETHKTVGIGVGMLDETGFGAGSACPVLPTFQVWGMSIDFDPDGKFCRILAVVRACFILLGAFLALRILMGG